MDTAQQIENTKAQLREVGFDEDRLNQLLDLAAEEAIDIAMEDLAETASDEVLDQLASGSKDEITTPEQAVERINKVFESAYGPNAEQKKLELILAYLQETLEQTKQAKDLLQRYQAGDPTAVAQVKAQEGNPDTQEILKKM